MNLLKKSLLTLSISLLATSSFADKFGPSVEELSDYLAERENLPLLDAAGSGCQILENTIDDEGFLTLTVQDLNHVMTVTLIDDGDERVGNYRGAETDLVEYTYVFDRILIAKNAEGDIRHLRLQRFNPDTGEVYETLDCAEFTLFAED